ncbi:MAG: hypothetical protein AAGG44_11510, partial [Planctomycetota bacterium]
SILGEEQSPKQMLLWGNNANRVNVEPSRVSAISLGRSLSDMRELPSPWSQQVDASLKFRSTGGFNVKLDKGQVAVDSSGDGVWRWACVDAEHSLDCGNGHAEQGGRDRLLFVGVDFRGSWETEPAVRYLLEEIIRSQFMKAK